MPILNSSYHKRPWYFFNGHMETIVPSVFFDLEFIYERERLELEDGDFLDLDWKRRGNKRLILLTHGLEGNSNRYYIKRPAKYFFERGWDILAWNCRSCSGEMNRLPRFYHHGDSEDLATVVNHALGFGYEKIVLIGFSMGGSMTLKFIGERSIDSRIAGAVTFSVPCNLRDSAEAVSKKGNKFYEKRFLKKLLKKIEVKSQMHESIDGDSLQEIIDFDEFHIRYTVPLHGFRDINDLYETATCDKYFEGIDIPVYIGNAKNDPMLGEKCYPSMVAEKSEYIFLEIPKYGGHVGFTTSVKGQSWMEERAEEFISSTLDV